VNRLRIITSLCVGLRENQDRIARRMMAMVSTSHTIRIKSRRNSIAA